MGYKEGRRRSSSDSPLLPLQTHAQGQVGAAPSPTGLAQVSQIQRLEDEELGNSELAGGRDGQVDQSASNPTGNRTPSSSLFRSTIHVLRRNFVLTWEKFSLKHACHCPVEDVISALGGWHQNQAAIPGPILLCSLTALSCLTLFTLLVSIYWSVSGVCHLIFLTILWILRCLVTLLRFSLVLIPFTSLIGVLFMMTTMTRLLKENNPTGPLQNDSRTYADLAENTDSQARDDSLLRLWGQTFCQHWNSLLYQKSVSDSIASSARESPPERSESGLRPEVHSERE